MIEYIDIQVGEIVQQLKDNGIYENTIIMLTSDNGPTYAGGVDFKYFNSTGVFQNDPKRMKGYTYEGGVRVPFIVSWPNKIKSKSYFSLRWRCNTTCYHRLYSRSTIS